MEIQKNCTKCNIVKDSTEFRSRAGPKANKDGLNPSCRQCEREAKQQYDLKKKQNDPLKLCSVCKITKHYSLFFQYSKKGTKCLECFEYEKRIKNYDQKCKQQEFRIQHQDNTKRCSKCRLFKSFEEFWKSKHTTDGFYSSCIECTKQSSLSKLPARRIKQSKWKKDNKEKYLSYQRTYDVTRRNTDPSYKLRRNVMHAIIASIRNYGFKNEQIINLNKAIFAYLPYTADQLKQHIESLWEEWMSWDNYGRFHSEHKTWQIDHVIPQSKLSFSNFEDENFQKLWALSNLRPLETIVNIKKSNKLLTERV